MGAASERPRPSSALAGFPRTIVSQPRGSNSTPYSPAAKSAYVLPRFAADRAGHRLDAQRRLAVEARGGEVGRPDVQVDVPEPVEVDDLAGDPARLDLGLGERHDDERARVERLAELFDRHARREVGGRGAERVGRAERLRVRSGGSRPPT